MPHISGDSGSGGSFDSGSSGSSGGSSGSSQATRISNRHFFNSRKFMYIDKNGRERCIYSLSEPLPQSTASFVVTMLLLIPFVIVGAAIIFIAIKQLIPLKPLTPVYAENGIHISDNAELISDKSKLEKNLNNFEDATGICPYIVTVEYSDWSRSYRTLERYSYNLYLDSFSDEQHFLIVYSVPQDETDLSGGEWVGVQGNDTDPIITEAAFARFKQDLQRNLDAESISAGEALNNAFAASLEYIMENSIDWELFFALVLGAFVWNGFIAYVIYVAIRGFIVSRRAYREVPMDNR